MEKTLEKHNILKQTSWCTVRPQEQQYVVYNTRTDELYLLPPTAFYVYQLCDGLNTVGDLEELVQGAFGAESDTVKAKLNKFLGGLIDRGIVELDG